MGRRSGAYRSSGPCASSGLPFRSATASRSAGLARETVTIVGAAGWSFGKVDLILPQLASPNEMNITLRAQVESDLSFLQDVVGRVVAQELGAADWPEPIRTQVLAFQTRARLGSNSGGALSQIILSDGAPVGWLATRATESELRIVDIVVAPEHQGRGIGASVLELVKGLAAKSNRSVGLHVNQTNEGAIRLYQRLGFRILGPDGPQYWMSWP